MTINIDDSQIEKIFSKALDKYMPKIEKIFTNLEERVEKIENKISELEECKKKHIKKLEKLEQDLETKINESEKKVNDMFEKIKEYISSLCEKTIKPHLEGINAKDKEIMSFLKKMEQDIQSLKEDKRSKLEEEKEKLKEEKISLQTKLENKETEIKGLKDELNTTKDELQKMEVDINYLQSEISNLEKLKNEEKTAKEKLEKELESKNEEIENLNNYSQTLKNQLSEYENRIKDLEGLKKYKEAFEDEKLQNLLDAILNNDVLIKFREEKGIVDKSPKSILNLVKFLNDDRSFVNSIYDYIVEYKQENQTEMSDNEIAFYKAVNNYFNKEVFYNIYKKVQEDRFDKSIHRGIGGEIRAELSDDRLVLVPSVNDSKMRVKVK